MPKSNEKWKSRIEKKIKRIVNVELIHSELQVATNPCMHPHSTHTGLFISKKLKKS